MPPPIQTTIVLGGGSAGFLAALAINKALPRMKVIVVRSPNIPIIGVGESTTPAVPRFLHQTLGFDRAEFWKQVRPSWKLGNRFLWGDPRDAHFNYPFDFGVCNADASLRKVHGYYCLEQMADASLYSALMNQGRSPLYVQPNGQLGIYDNHAYHLENKTFVAYLEQQARLRGVTILDDDVVAVMRRDDGGVASLRLASGTDLAGELFIDCSGFASCLLGKTLNEPYISYAEGLLCDTAVIGSWSRSDEVLPYTTAETMDAGWCWRIEFVDQITRGYVFSSQFISVDEAMREIKAKNPQLPDDLRVVKFRCGRYERHWVHNVVAIGNSAGFVEPLEATALQVIVEQLRFLCKALLDTDTQVPPVMQTLENRRGREIWDDIRDFLALHYRFNRRLDTPFWRHCREHVPLGGAEAFVEYFQAAGPSLLAAPLIRQESIFGLEGYLTILLGQRTPTHCPLNLSPSDWQAWDAYRERLRQTAARNLTMAQSAAIISGQ